MPRRSPGPTARTRLGLYAQRLARRHLEENGFRTIAENVRYRAGELDIVGIMDDAFVAVEVRSRTGESLGTPEESITPAKAERLVRLAYTYRDENSEGDLPPNTRIDVVAVVLDRRGRLVRLTWHRNAIEDGGGSFDAA